MADTEKDLLFMGVGFFVTLFLMTHFKALRPAAAQSMASAPWIPDRPYDNINDAEKMRKWRVV